MWTTFSLCDEPVKEDDVPQSVVPTAEEELKDMVSKEVAINRPESKAGSQAKRS